MLRVIALACTAGMIGCGGGGISEADRERAREVLADYGRAFAAQDGVAGCRLLTDDMRARYERRRDACPVAFRRSASIEDDRDLRFTRASITGEQEEGLRGVVEFSGRPGYGGEVHLVMQDGRWRLDRDLLCITPRCNP